MTTPSDKDVELLKGAMMANVDQGTAAIDDLLSEIKGSPEIWEQVYPREALDRFIDGMEKIKREFEEIQKDVKESP